MSDIAIRVRNLGKRYRIGAQRTVSTNLRDALKQAALSPFGYLMSTLRPASEDETLWALRDVSFDVKEGEVLGIIGRNGAGKSTLLKILSRITEPTTGYADLHGRVGSLLEVGTGFHPELTGRENIYMNGAMLGMTRAEIEAKFDEIISFAGTERFIDTPVKRYSSGMRVRLAFAVAAHLEPEILIVDEVLAVGDASFQKKCIGKMSDVASSGRTVIFVSHTMGAINRLCDYVHWLDNGSIIMSGIPHEVTSHYLAEGTDALAQREWPEGVTVDDRRRTLLTAARVLNSESQIKSSLDLRKPFYIEMNYRLLVDLPNCRAGFMITNNDGIVVLDRFDADDEKYGGPREAGDYVTRCEIPPYLLSPGRYTVTIIMDSPNYYGEWVYVENALAFDIEDTDDRGVQFGERRQGLIRPNLPWQTRMVESNHTDAEREISQP